MRKLVAMVTLSTVAALGAVTTVAGTASALETDGRIAQATVEGDDTQIVLLERDDDVLMTPSTHEQTTDPQRPADGTVPDQDRGANLQALEALMESAFRELADHLRALAEKDSYLSAQELLETQMLMNNFSQLTAMASSVASHASAAPSDMSRSIKR